jgi:hypothetical protein
MIYCSQCTPGRPQLANCGGMVGGYQQQPFRLKRPLLHRLVEWTIHHHFNGLWAPPAELSSPCHVLLSRYLIPSACLDGHFLPIRAGMVGGYYHLPFSRKR